MASVTFEHASVTYPGASSPAVNDLNLTIEDGEFLVLVGPSGCGKSTTLRMVAGFEELDSGRILIGNQDITSLPPQERDIAMVFQNYALYPHMTVADNMGFALKIAGMPADQIAERVREAAKILEIEHLLDAKPKELSGGQRQRVAMGRAIVREPQVFLMDEPLSNLDAQLRAQTRAQIIQLQRRLGITTIYVTHDQTEAMTMGSRIAVLNNGVIQQVATPSDMYENPPNVFVASFIGSPSMNIGTLPVRDGAVHFAGLSFPLPASVVAALGGADSVTVGVRPEAWTLKRASEGADGEAASEASTNGEANTNSEAATTSDNAEQLTFTGRIAYVESLGSHAYPYVELTHTGGVHFASGAESSLIAMRTADHDLPEPGAEVLATVRRSAVHYFHPVTGVRIPA